RRPRLPRPISISLLTASRLPGAADTAWQRVSLSVPAGTVSGTGRHHGEAHPRRTGATMSWSSGPLLGFDTETTGVDPENDRLVTAALVLRADGRTTTRGWIVDPG